ncbi:hypothetical protein KKG56_03095 [bacterium]|nr:hypothetical protein [bacterium]
MVELKIMNYELKIIGLLRESGIRRRKTEVRILVGAGSKPALPKPALPKPALPESGVQRQKTEGGIPW